MFQKVFLCLTFAIWVSNFTRSDPDFTFADQKEWKNKFPDCGKSQQSPIDINSDNIEKMSNFGKIEFDNMYKIPLYYKVENTGHAVVITGEWMDGQTPTILGGPLKGKYYFGAVYVVWSSRNGVGSAHALDGSLYDAEILFFFRKSDYDTLEEAIYKENGLVVVSHVLEENDYVRTPLSHFDHAILQVREPGMTANVTPTALQDLGLNLGEKYYKYTGSMPLPPCTEGVVWLVGTERKPIQQQQLDGLRTVKLFGHDIMNRRFLQQSNGRKVYELEN